VGLVARRPVRKVGAMWWSLWLASALASAGGEHQQQVVVDAPRSAEVAEARPPRAAGVALERGVRHRGGFRGWWRDFEPEALQEAWCLAIEHHPEVVGMSDREVREAVVDVPRRGGRVAQARLERRLFELGVKARNAVLRDNHLNRRTGGRVATFGPYTEEG
jgi:hypothetical protein